MNKLHFILYLRIIHPVFLHQKEFYNQISFKLFNICKKKSGFIICIVTIPYWKKSCPNLLINIQSDKNKIKSESSLRKSKKNCKIKSIFRYH